MLSSNDTLYGDMSSRAMRAPGAEAPDLEIYSVDEALLGLSGLVDPVARMRAVRSTMVRWTGVAMSVEIGPSKTLAKVANRLAKKAPEADDVLVPWTRPTRRPRSPGSS